MYIQIWTYDNTLTDIRTWPRKSGTHDFYGLRLGDNNFKRVYRRYDLMLPSGSRGRTVRFKWRRGCSSNVLCRKDIYIIYLLKPWSEFDFMRTCPPLNHCRGTRRSRAEHGPRTARSRTITIAWTTNDLVRHKRLWTHLGKHTFCRPLRVNTTSNMFFFT